MHQPMVCVQSSPTSCRMEKSVRLCSLLGPECNYAQIERGFCPRLWNQEVPPVPLWSKIDSHHRPQATARYIYLSQRKECHPWQLQDCKDGLSYSPHIANYELQFKPTDLHANADGLSRLPLQSNSRLGDTPSASIHNIHQIQAIPLTAQAVRNATHPNLILSKVR